MSFKGTDFTPNLASQDSWQVGGSPFGDMGADQEMSPADDQMEQYAIEQRQQDLYAKKAQVESIQVQLQDAQANGSSVQGSINTAAIDAALQSSGDKAQAEVALTGAEQEVNKAQQLETSLALEKVGGALQAAALAGTLGGLAAGVAAVAHLVDSNDKIKDTMRDTYDYMKTNALLTTPNGEVYDHNKEILAAQEKEQEVEPTKKTLVLNNNASLAALGTLAVQADLKNLRPDLGMGQSLTS